MTSLGFLLAILALPAPNAAAQSLESAAAFRARLPGRKARLTGAEARPTDREEESPYTRLSNHLFRYGLESEDLTGAPARCIRVERTPGRSGTETSACLQISWEVMPEQPGVYFAVQRASIGELTLIIEKWTKLSPGKYGIVQLQFIAGPTGELLSVYKTRFLGPEKGDAAMLEAPEVLDANSPETLELWKTLSEGVLLLAPRISI